MNRIKNLVLILLFMVTIYACSNQETQERELIDKIPMVMVEDHIYLDTGKQIKVEIDDSAIIGTITSEVDGWEIPSQNGQSNFGCIGAEYAYFDDGLVVMINNKWQLFRKDTKKLSMDDVMKLSEKGNELSWQDFEEYDSKEIGSGLYIRKYDIDEKYYLLIGGGSVNDKPMYIRLVRTEDSDKYIDIRTDDINDFITKVN